MARPYSIDLRERVVAAVRAGASCRAVAARFGVAVSSVVKWVQRAARTGSVAPGKMGGHRTPILAPHRDFILGRLEERPETTLHEMKDALMRERGVRVSHDTVWRFLRAERQSFKKKPAGQRDGASGRGAPAGALDAAPGPGGSAPARLR
jgi:putative transposase